MASKQRVLFDTNVLIDVLARREPFLGDSARAWNTAAVKTVEGVVAAVTCGNIYYIVRRASDARNAARAVRTVLDVFSVDATDRDIITDALSSPIADFEDAIQYRTAVRTGAALIVTRNVRDFRAGEIVAMTPAEYLSTFPAPEEGHP